MQTETRYCPNCGRTVLTLNGRLVRDRCLNCGYDLTQEEWEESEPQEAENEPEETPEPESRPRSIPQPEPVVREPSPPEQEGAEPERESPRAPQETEVDENFIADEDDLRQIREKQMVECYYCHHKNPFSKRRCEVCGFDLSFSPERKDESMESRLVNQMNSEEQERFLIEGLKSFIEMQMKKQGSNEGYVRCQNPNCNGVYHYSRFQCPQCKNPALLEEMRAVLNGNLNNKDLIKQFQEAFFQFKILKHTSSATLHPQMISAIKADIDNTARITARILQTTSKFLRSQTSEPTKSSDGDGDRNASPIPDLDESASISRSSSGNSQQFDTRVLDIMDDEFGINIENGDGPNDAPMDDEMSDDATDDGAETDEDDWTNV